MIVVYCFVVQLCINSRSTESWSWNMPQWWWHPTTVLRLNSVSSFTNETHSFTNGCKGRLRDRMVDFINLRLKTWIQRLKDVAPIWTRDCIHIAYLMLIQFMGISSNIFEQLEVCLIIVSLNDSLWMPLLHMRIVGYIFCYLPWVRVRVSNVSVSYSILRLMSINGRHLYEINQFKRNQSCYGKGWIGTKWPKKLDWGTSKCIQVNSWQNKRGKPLFVL